MVDFNHLVVRSKQRIRLEFSDSLAAGAFATSWYTLNSEDSATGNPVVLAAMQVPSLPAFVEVVLDRELAPGAQYRLILAVGIPANDASTVPATEQIFWTPEPPQAPSISVSARDLLVLIFQEDILHDPTVGHALGVDGDLATVTGPENVRLNVLRGMISEGLPHRFGWGGDAREAVDAPTPLLPSLRGRLENQARKDDRVQRARVAVVSDANNGDVVLNCGLDLIGQVKISIKERLRARS